MQIYLIGFMGTGKTSTGIELSKLTGRRFLDSDELIVKQEKKTIPQIFAESGETGFRRIETEVFRHLSQEQQECVVSCGGGAPLRDENVSLMKKNGVVVRLTATAETVYDRVKDDRSRPMLYSDDPMQRIKDLMAEREPKYRAAADITIITDDRAPEDIASEIAECLTKKR